MIVLLPLGLLVGASIALAGHHLEQDGALRHPAHASAWLVAGGALLPVAVYVALRYPDWGLLYLAEAAELSDALRAVLVLAAPLCAALGCVLTLVAARGTRLGGYGVLAAAVATWLGVLTWGWGRVVRVGSYDMYHAGARNLMPMLLDDRLGAALLIALAVLMGVWGYALLTLRGRADTLGE